MVELAGAQLPSVSLLVAGRMSEWRWGRSETSVPQLEG